MTGLALAAVAGKGAAQVRTAPPDAARLAAFDAYVADAVQDWNVPGLAIALVHGDSLILARGYGVREIGRTEPVTAHTRFAIGSTTKAMTTAALAMLVDEGRLSWDDRVIEYLPELRLHDPYATRELTVRDLLTHRTGLPGTDLYWGGLGYTIDEMVRRIEHVEPVSSFRSRWNYQNVVYALGGALIERITGTPWDAFVRTRLFDPLGMTETEPLDADILTRPNVAVPHDATNDSLHVVPQRSVDAVASVGSVWSSVTDMSKWLRFMLDSARVNGRPLISAPTFHEMVTPEVRAQMLYPALELVKPHLFMYALGWFVQDYDGEVVWMHTGSINGMSAIVGLLPRHRFGMVALVNRDHAELRHALMYRSFDLIRGSPDRDWSTELRAHLERAAQPPVAQAPATPPSLPLDQYAGTYAHPGYAEIVVELRDGALRARIGGRGEQVLEHRTFEVFRTRAAEPGQSMYALTFDPDGTGNIAGVRLYGVLFERVRSPRTP